MATIDWPGDLPDGVVVPTMLRDAYSQSPRSAVLESDFGLIPRRRQIYAAVTGEPEIISAQWMFTPDGENAFRRFFKYDLGMGAAWFNVPLLMSSGEVETREVSFFRDAPVIEPYGALSTRVTATLITRRGLAPEDV